MNDVNMQYFPHREVDKPKWDNCVHTAENGLIYGYSFYLDHMARHWDGLVLNDYEAVMPLTWNKKFGISYLYQPPFTASLGIFGNNLTEGIIKRSIELIPKKFRLIEISLNFGNLVSPSPFLVSRTNYVLSMNKTYDALHSCYRENHQRNIQKALKAECVVKKNIEVDEIIHLHKIQMKDLAPVADSDYGRFKKLYRFLFDQKKATTYGVVNKQGKMLCSCVFFVSDDRAYYILAGNHPEGRNTGASQLLIDAFIKDHAGENLILDFEGSDIESLALFYAGFGATKEIYPAIRWNRLPRYLRWMKPGY
jgi:hypothetical protein